MFFSATLDGEVGELARLYTPDPVRVEAELPDDQAYGEIAHRFVPVTLDNKLETLVSIVGAEEGLSLVFVRTKRGADRLAQRLETSGINALAMHGDLSQGQRERALARFESGKVSTLIATDVAARGLDLDDVTLVINYDPPEDGKAYTHRVGRTGRAGRSGDAVTLVLPEQQADVSRVARLNGQTDKFQETGMTVAAPKLVYSSRGRNSKWGPVTATQDLEADRGFPMLLDGSPTAVDRESVPCHHRRALPGEEHDRRRHLVGCRKTPREVCLPSTSA